MFTNKPIRSWRLIIKDNPSVLFDYEIGAKQYKSKNKVKNSKTKRKDRITEINFTFRNQVILISTRISLDTSEIQLIGYSTIFSTQPEIIVPDFFELTNFYERAKKRKILNYFCMQNQLPPANISWLIRKHEIFYAIDTNSIKYKDIGKVSVSTILEGKSYDINNGYSACECNHFSTEVYSNLTVNPEIYAIIQLIEKIKPYHNYKSKFHIGIVTDQLDSIKQYNLREKPLIENYFLPYGFHLSYATDASGSEEYLPNRLIRECENQSKNIITKMEKENNWKREETR